MIVNDNTVQAESRGEFFNNLAKFELMYQKNIAKNVLENPGRALENWANVGTTFASRSSKAALSWLPEMIDF